jgi:hypothetical protein
MTLIIIILTVIRKPQLLYIPRFYAEEGQSYFSFAYNNSLIHYILSPMFGYYSLYNVIATSFATLFKLEYAPLITTYLALIVQVAVSIYVIWSDIPILNSYAKRFLVAISFPLLCPPQVWLTTIGIQYWLCIITALILLDGFTSDIKPTHVVKAIILILTGLTGVLSCIMTPIFIFKWVKSKSKQFILYISMLIMCSIIQILIFLQALLRHDNGLNNRFVAHNKVSDLMYTSSLNFLGSLLIPKENIYVTFIDKLDKIIKYTMFNIMGKYRFGEEESIFIVTSFIIILVIMPLALHYITNIEYITVLMSSITVYLSSIILSINVRGGPRYLFAPSAMLILFLIASYSKNTFSLAYRIILSSVIAIIIIIHINDYVPSMNRTYNDDWPVWKDEVHNWRLHKNYPLKIWPPPWQMNLN